MHKHWPLIFQIEAKLPNLQVNNSPLKKTKNYIFTFLCGYLITFGKIFTDA